MKDIMIDKRETKNGLSYQYRFEIASALQNPFLYFQPMFASGQHDRTDLLNNYKK